MEKEVNDEDNKVEEEENKGMMRRMNRRKLRRMGEKTKNVETQ